MTKTDQATKLLADLNKLLSTPSLQDFFPLFTGMIEYINAPHTFSMSEITYLMMQCEEARAKNPSTTIPCVIYASDRLASHTPFETNG